MAENALDLSSVNKHAPAPPSKWDIIPIHQSDRMNFLECRRKWDWSSPTRTNLTRKVRYYGIEWPLFFGTAIHYALEQYYNPVLNHDPVVEFMAFMDLHWNGGVVSASDLEKFGLEDREPSKLSDETYEVQGLNILLPDPDPTEWDEYVKLGIGMLEFYKDYSRREDNFSVLSVEHVFSVPILDPETGKALYMEDKREMPDVWYEVENATSAEENEYGPLYRLEKNADGEWCYMKQVHSRGKMDKIIQENSIGLFGFHDYKTSGRAIDDDYFKHLELDEQVTNYFYSAEREAQMWGLEYKKLDFMIYEAIFKGFPSPPTMLKSGLPSIARSTETASAQMFEQFIVDHGLQVVYEADRRMQAYFEYLLLEGDKRFVNRKRIIRNEAQKRNCGIRLYNEAMDMLSDPRIYHNPRKEYSCLKCAFRTPCTMVENGSDFVQILSDSYELNYDR